MEQAILATMAGIIYLQAEERAEELRRRIRARKAKIQRMRRRYLFACLSVLVRPATTQICRLTYNTQNTKTFVTNIKTCFSHASHLYSYILK